MSRTPAAIKQNIARRVNEARAEGRPVNELVDALAREHGVSRSSIFYWAAGQYTAPRTRTPLTESELTVIARHHGNIRAAWNELHAAGLDISYRQFCRRLDNTDTDFRLAVTEGVKAMLKAGLYNVMEDQYQRGDVFGFDHTEIPVFVAEPGDSKPKKVWISVALDWATRFIFTPVFTEGHDGLKGDPNTTTIKSLVGSVMVGQDFDGHVVGGIPEVWVFDNALAHLSNAVQNGYGSLGVIAHAIRPGSPWENGPTENAIHVIEQQVWAKLPGYTNHLPTRYEKNLWGQDELLTPKELMAYTLVGIDTINRELPMDRLDGKTRLQAWLDAPNLMRYATIEDINVAFTEAPRGRYKVTKSGVSFKKVWYTHPALAGHVGRTVQVAHLPTDPSYINIHLNGELLCTATPAKSLPPEARKALARQRRSRVRRAELIQKASKVRAADLADRAQVEAILNGDEPSEQPDSTLTYDGWEVEDEAERLMLEMGERKYGRVDLSKFNAEGEEGDDANHR